MINFMKFKNLYFALSLAVIIPGVISLALYGLKPAIDFTGGSLLEIDFVENYPDQSSLSETLSSYQLEHIQPVGDTKYAFKLKPIDRQVAAGITASLTDSYGAVIETRFETIGPAVGKELIRKTLIAVALATAAILLFIMKQFNELKYGICAVLAMLHDSLILLGVFSILGHFQGVEVDLLFVTAVLTVLSFSVHDTIVVYDRVRENLRKNRGADFTSVVNQAVAETLARSINNSMTIIFMLLALWLMGGETTRWFVFALLIGTVTGTYSSTFTAAPLLVVWENIKTKRK